MADDMIYDMAKETASSEVTVIGSIMALMS